MKYSDITARLNKLGPDKWAIHHRALSMKAQGLPVVMASIGQPEIEASPVVTESCIAALKAGRTGYSTGQGEKHLLSAIADHYNARRKTELSAQNVMTVPGTQTALYVALSGVVSPGDEVLVGDPYYVTYEGVIAAPGGQFVPVPLQAEKGFRLQADALEAAVTPKSRVILLTTPHNPTGAVLSAEDIKAIGEVAKAHDLWIFSDEVYEDLVFEGDFASPLDFPDLAERTVVLSSISKSHAAPGFRSGWIVAPEEFIRRVLPLSEAILFGNQPFIADATVEALQQPNPTGALMRESYQRRARALIDGLAGVSSVRAMMPDAGMFLMLDVRGTGMSDETFAWSLLDQQQVSVMPGSAFGSQGEGFVRISLTLSDADIDKIVIGVTTLLRGAAA
ncbi:pyridoxal phosphate-dependent aminotransferase [Rhodovibrionaceae bacterium A322]